MGDNEGVTAIGFRGGARGEGTDAWILAGRMLQRWKVLDASGQKVGIGFALFWPLIGSSSGTARSGTSLLARCSMISKGLQPTLSSFWIS